MRRLFLPACLCLVTLSFAAGSDSGFSLEQFSAAILDDNEKALERLVAAPAGENNVQVPLVVAEPAINVPAIDASGSSATKQSGPPEKPMASGSNREICDTVIEAAQSNNLPVPFFIHLLFQESGFKPNIVSRAGAQGIAQFMPETAATVGLDNPFDPLQAIAASARLLRNLVRQFGNLGLAAAAYNAGPRRIQDWLAKKGKLPDETQNYVKIITGRPAQAWASTAPSNPALTVPHDAPCQEAAGLVALSAPQDSAPESHRSAAGFHSRGREMIAARGRVKLARFPTEKTPTIIADERSSRKSGKITASRVAKREKAAKGAVQLAAASKKRHHKVQLSLG